MSSFAGSYQYYQEFMITKIFSYNITDKTVKAMVY